MRDRFATKMFFTFLILFGLLNTKMALADPKDSKGEDHDDLARDGVDLDDHDHDDHDDDDDEKEKEKENELKGYVRVTKANESFVVEEGETLAMACNVDTSQADEPLPAIRWWKGEPNERLLFSDGIPSEDVDSTWAYRVENHTLVIKSANARSAGLYSCTITDKAKTGHFVELKDGGHREFSSDRAGRKDAGGVVFLAMILMISVRLL